MAEELGRAAKPSAADVLAKRKVYIAVMVQPSPGAPEGFTERLDAYWTAVEEQLSGLEAKAGAVNRIFIEGVIGRGDDALLMLEQPNLRAHNLVKGRIDSGAVLEAYEDDDLFGQVIDWGRCLQAGLISRTVADQVGHNYTEAAEKRQTHLESRLAEGIGEAEAALLLTGANNTVIPDSVERFIISPPQLDELERWVQAANEAIRRDMEAEARGEQPRAADPVGDAQGGASSSGLWTPGQAH